MCGKLYVRNKRYSDAQWNKSKLCSMKCVGLYQKTVPHRSGWKHTQETLKQMSENNYMKNRFSSESYGSIHQWLRKNFKKGKCEHCGAIRFNEFALRTGFKHTHHRDNYIVLCSSCHKKYDYTDERKARLSNSLKGRIIHWKGKISLANRGRILSIETRKKYSEYRKLNPRERGSDGKFISNKKI